jgi:23S rRNA (cytidine1920-2'-O)/16S rRNA (cytidine1409-2'-O)-methyltransferase
MERLDKLLVNKELVETREKSQRLIMAGLVKVNGIVQTKCGHKFPENLKIEISETEMPYVSRGGLKLEKAIYEFSIDFKDKNILDIGASTGGFTDCALQFGAKKVYAMDVGYGQLHYRLRNDKRVVLIEKFNARDIDENTLPEKVDLITIDVSFISLSKIIPSAMKTLKENGEVIALIKPQFETDKKYVEKGGVVRKSSTHKAVINNIVDIVKSNNLTIKGLTQSPIKGPSGNIEFLIYCKYKDKSQPLEITNELIEKVIQNED